ncbi:phosphoglycerate mutase [Ramlibacter sp. WS9]|uniref:phosphoglycerate mutase n=1 Tax=Ramlibacter sp. WS9 TaxID=1882741 RepID=UPI001144118C|nr:phosphoglycerate mutase [Ramlibacter sp. WS9]ROZ76106.1 phosphoglycerate mutase [Ramlibacter sp. WS9]
MSDGTHLLIPYASSTADGCVQALKPLALPHLEKLLARMTAAGRDDGDESTLSMPHERALARAIGLTDQDGLIPWAAWEAHQAGRDIGAGAWARITPCHWRVGTGQVAMDPPSTLHLDEGQSRALLDAMQPYFREDRIALEFHQPMFWLAQGEIFRDLPTASLERVAGRSVDDWMPRMREAAPLRRLQQEMQMLLYTHPVNEERERTGLLPVNSFWVNGAGVLVGEPAAPAGLSIALSLRDAAVQGDWQAWAAVWQQVDATECARLLADLDAGKPATLTLCGERSAQTFTGAGGGGLLRRLRAMAAGRKATMQLEAL